MCFIGQTYSMMIVCNLNVSPGPSPPLNPLVIELRTVVKNLHIELASTLKMFLISIIVGLLVLLSLDKPLFSFNAPSCRSTTYRNKFLLLLILLFFIIFEFYFITISQDACVAKLGHVSISC